MGACVVDGGVVGLLIFSGIAIERVTDYHSFEDDVIFHLIFHNSIRTDDHIPYLLEGLDDSKHLVGVLLKDIEFQSDLVTPSVNK